MISIESLWLAVKDLPQAVLMVTGLICSMEWNSEIPLERQLEAAESIN